MKIHYAGIGCIGGETQPDEESPRQESQCDSCRGASPNRRYPYQWKPKRFRGMLHVTEVAGGISRPSAPRQGLLPAGFSGIVGRRICVIKHAPMAGPAVHVETTVVEVDNIIPGNGDSVIRILSGAQGGRETGFVLHDAGKAQVVNLDDGTGFLGSLNDALQAGLANNIDFHFLCFEH